MPKTKAKKGTRKDWQDLHRWMSRRIALVAALFGSIAIVIIGRAYQLQIIRSAEYSLAAKKQAVGSTTIRAKRGVIKDRHEVDLAISVDVDSVFAEPRTILDPGKAAASLAGILQIPKKKLEKKLSGSRQFVYLKRRVDAETANRVRALEIKGIGTRPEPRRFYSHRDLAAHVLGFTNLAGEGKAGVERTFDPDLSGDTLEVARLRDALGNAVFQDGLVPAAALEGDDLILTIDRQIQYVAEEELAAAVKYAEGKAGVAVVLDPSSGDILALASYPSFNPNNLSGSTPNDHLNRVVSAVFEPGSTMKMVTVAAALEEELVSPNDVVDCEGGRWRVGGRTIRDSNHEYGVLSIAEILKVSSNICAAKIGMGLGRQRLYDWLKRFGFGDRTGIELPGELDGLLRPSKAWRDITLANISFGQGLSVTPLQVVQAAQVIANGGVRVAPRIVSAVQDKSGTKRKLERPEPARVLSAKTARVLTSMLSEVTNEGGTAEQAAIPGFVVAGKTGTAQKIDPVTRAYSRSLYVASFVGFVPADAPKAVVMVLIDEPKKSIYGGVVAAPAFKAIATQTLSALGVYPSDPEAKSRFVESFKAAQRPAPVPEKTSGMPLGVRLSPEALALLGEPAEVPQTNEVRRDLDKAFSRGLTPLESELSEEAPSPRPTDRMPNFADLALREVLNRSAQARCDLVLKGTGRVVKQSPAPGAPIKEGARCVVELSPRS